jgi:hypothetical protein
MDSQNRLAKKNAKRRAAQEKGRRRREGTAIILITTPTKLSYSLEYTLESETLANNTLFILAILA